jgi:hypothetical protein
MGVFYFMQVRSNCLISKITGRSTVVQNGVLFFTYSLCRNNFILILLSFHLAINPKPGDVIPDDQLANIRALLNLFNNTTETWGRSFFIRQPNGLVERMTDFQVR